METGRHASRDLDKADADGLPLLDNCRTMGNQVIHDLDKTSCCKYNYQPSKKRRRPITEEDHSHWLLGQKPLRRVRHVTEDSKAGIREKIISAIPSPSEYSLPVKTNPSAKNCSIILSRKIQPLKRRGRPPKRGIKCTKTGVSSEKTSSVPSKLSHVIKYPKTTSVSSEKSSSVPSKISHGAKRLNSGIKRGRPPKVIKDPKTAVSSNKMSKMASRRSRRAKRFSSRPERARPTEMTEETDIKDPKTDISAKKTSPVLSKRSHRSKRVNSNLERAQPSEMVEETETNIAAKETSVSPSKRSRTVTKCESGSERVQPNEKIENPKAVDPVPSKNSHPTTRLDSGFGSEVGSGSETMDVDMWPSPTASGSSEDNQGSEVTGGHGTKAHSDNNHDDIEAEHLQAMAGIELLRSRIRELKRTKLELERTKMELCEVREEARRDMEEVERRANVNMVAAVQKEIETVKKQAELDIRKIKKECEVQQGDLQDRLAREVLANHKLKTLYQQTKNELQLECAKAKKTEVLVRAAEEKALRKMDAMQRKMQGKLDLAEKERKKAVEDIKRVSKMEIEGYQRTAEQAVIRYNKLIAEYNVLESRITDAAKLLSPMTMSSRPVKEGS